MSVPASLRLAVSSASTADAASGDSATGSILPVQGAYYATMFASMPAKMLISMSNSMSASQALQAGNQAMLADVSKMVDAKMKAMLGKHFRPDARVRIVDQCAAGVGAATGRVVDTERLGRECAGDGPRGPGAAANSIAAPSAAAPLPNSPYTQALMGAMNGRGMGTQAAKTASVKVETRTPAGG